MVKYDLSKGLSVYRHLLSFAFPYWKVFALATIAMAIYGATESGFALYMKPLLDGGFVQKDPEVIRWLPFGILAIFLVRGVTGFLSTYWMAWLGRQVIAELRKRLFDHLLFLPVKFYEATSSGYVLSMFSFNVEQVYSPLLLP